MYAYTVRRLLLIIPTLIMVTLIIFFSVRFIPGSTVDLMIAEQLEGGTLYVDRAAIEQQLGLDVPVHVQYGRWVERIFMHGDLGESLWTGRSVLQSIANALPVSLELGILALMFSLGIALPVGIYSGIRQDTGGDYIGRSFAIACVALPSFWLGTMVMIFPSVWWDWSPPIMYTPFIEDPIGNLGMFIIPGFILGMFLSGTTMRMTRTMMLEVLRQDYIRTAWAKGLKERVVVIRHALKNALIPVISIVGIHLPIMIGGSIVLEKIFCLPGVGWLIVDVVNARDYTVLSGINLVIACFVLLLNLLIDLTYSYLDPRIVYK